MPEESSRASYWKTWTFETDTLDELIDVSPKGRIFHFEIEATSSEGNVHLKVGGPHKKDRRLMLHGEASGSDVPGVFHKIATMLEPAEKRGTKLHYLGAFIGPTMALYIPMLIFTLLWPGLGFFTDPPADAKDKPALAVVASALALLILLPLGMGIFSRITASSVTLRPRFDPSALKPEIDFASMPRRFLETVAAGLRWVASLYKHDELAQQKMLIATVTAAFFGIGSFIIATLAWLFPLR
ncbi:hypothetical protein VAB18032_07430 [Micromonospora maris AB-18-032]|uniref:Uncharacterized protein n=1 Tax=Micromonospora maris TaxID=1003110 RepID=A0A9X0I724_9ACTN|nr:hypothetical protein VAB18032_07430 [Micromonospora maris AB-18-032]KUJ48052.1 hypothetical protein ADL17_02910 [Micromonospora maris]